MQAISTYSSLLTQINTMTSTSQLTQKLSYELSSGTKAVDLADNPDRQQVLDLTVSKDKREGYIKSCTLAAVTTSEYSVSLKNLETLATNAMKSVESLRTTYTGISSASGSTATTATDALSAFSDLGQTIDQAMTEVTVGLNERTASGAYLYSGLRQPTGASSPATTLPPVSDLTQLPYFLGSTSSAPNPAGTTVSGYTPPSNAVDAYTTPASGSNPDLPAYDADFGASRPAASSALVAMATGTQKVTIDDKESVTLNITSNATAFQDLINGLRAAKTAADQAGTYSTADRDTFMNLAYSSLTKAVDGIRTLENQNSVTDAAVQNKSTQHTDSVNLMTSRLDTLVGVDTTTVTVQLATLNNQLSASYKATASLLNMSLMNYLK